VHPDDAERFWVDREAALDPANPKRSASEFRIRRRNGEIRWVEAHRLAYFEGAGLERRVVSFGGTVQDITERKEREEKEHLLMRLDRSPDRHQKPPRFRRALLRAHPGAFSQSGPARPE